MVNRYFWFLLTTVGLLFVFLIIWCLNNTGAPMPGVLEQVLAQPRVVSAIPSQPRNAQAININ